MDSSDSQNSTTWHTTSSFRKPQPARETTPWTTTRCHRLLRPLKTHISALRREVELESAEALSDGAPADGASDLGRPTTAGRPKIQHTYSRRGRRPAREVNSCGRQGPETPKPPKVSRLPSKKTMQPGEIVLPTPVIRRARGQQLSSPVQQPAQQPALTKPRATGSSKAPGGPRPSSLISALETQMLPLRGCVSPTRFFLHESILRALHALLAATGEPSAGTTRGGGGGKSLMAMCLRRVPEYIGELEDWEQREAEEQGTKSTLQSSEVSNEVYEAVEAMLPPGRGCPQLRTVLRAHGLKVVRDAVVEGLLDDGFSLLLVSLCSRTKSYLGAEGLLEAILDRPYPKPKSVGSTFDEARKLAPLKALRDFARESGRPQFMLRQLSRLVSRQLLPLSWLSTKEFSTIWSGIVKALSGNGVCDDTASFAILMITTLSSRARTTPFTLKPETDGSKSLSQQTLISAITAVASLPLLRQGAGDLPAHLTASTSKRVGYIIQACIHELRRARKAGWISTVLHLAAYFIKAPQDISKETGMSELWGHIVQHRDRRDGKQHYEAATAVICCLAQYCGRGTAEPSHHHLTKLCDQLDSIIATADEAKSRKIRIDCAFFLAERTNDLRDLAFAESFDVAAKADDQTIRPTPREQAASSPFVGFRWDEGISEWVTATPVAQQLRSRSSLLSSRSRGSHYSDSGDETYSGAELDDSGDSGDDPRAAFRGVSASAKQIGLHSSQRPRLTRAATTRAQQGSARLSTSRKRSHPPTGLLSLQIGDSEDEEDRENRICRSSNDGSKNTSHLGRRGFGRGLGQENRRVVVVSSCAGPPPPKRPRVAAALKPRQSILRTISNAGREELSDDELGL